MNLRLGLAALMLAIAPAVQAVTCSVSSAGVAFGSYVPTANTAVTSVGSVTVTCASTTAATVSYSIAMSTGSGSFANRSMTAGTYTLHYNLFTDIGHTLIWGDGSVGTSTVADSYTISLVPIIRTYPVYGAIPAAQTNAGAGTYTDVVVLTLTF